MNRLKKQFINETKEIKQKLNDKEYDIGMLSEEHPCFHVLCEAMNNEIVSFKEGSKKIGEMWHGNDRAMTGKLKLFCNDSWFRFSVIMMTDLYMKVLDMEDIYEAFNRALYVNYIRYIATMLGFDVVHDDRIP